MGGRRTAKEGERLQDLTFTSPLSSYKRDRMCQYPLILSSCDTLRHSHLAHLTTPIMIAKTIVILSLVALAFAEPKPAIVSSQTVTTTQHAAPILAAAPVVAAAPALSYASPYIASPYVASPYVASPYVASSWGYPGYYGAAYTAPLVSHAAPIVSAGYTVPSVYGYSLNSGLVSPYHNYLLLKKKK